MIGENTEGCSGSDISVVTREALMEPLRKCQTAKHFVPCTEHGQCLVQEQLADRNFQLSFLTPASQYPPCSSCPQKLSVGRCGDPSNHEAWTCRNTYCRSIRTTIYEMSGDLSTKLVPPCVGFKDFEAALSHSASTVAEDEIEQFVSWTNEFGQEG